MPLQKRRLGKARRSSSELCVRPHHLKNRQPHNVLDAVRHDCHIDCVWNVAIMVIDK